MINFSLFIYFIKKNYLVWVGVMWFIMLELLTCIFMMDMIAEMLGQMDGFFGVYVPKGEYALSYVAGLYPMYMCMFPVIFIATMTHKLISRTVDTTALSPILAGGVKRSTYLFTVAAFIAFGLFAMFLVTYVVCGLAMLIWGSFNWIHWGHLNLCFLLVNLAAAAICFFLSAVFAATKTALATSIGIPVMSVIFLAFGGFWHGFQYMSIYGYFDAGKIAVGAFNLWWLYVIIYTVAVVAFTVAGVLTFRKKRLSI
jgi:hypothetical protein